MEEVEQAVRQAHTRYDSSDGKPCFVGEVNGRNIKVVVAPDDEDLVITAYVQ
jgi:hypothetical protein